MGIVERILSASTIEDAELNPIRDGRIVNRDQSHPDYVAGRNAYLAGGDRDGSRSKGYQRGWYHEHYDCLEATGRGRPKDGQLVTA